MEIIFNIIWRAIGHCHFYLQKSHCGERIHVDTFLFQSWLPSSLPQILFRMLLGLSLLFLFGVSRLLLKVQAADPGIWLEQFFHPEDRDGVLSWKIGSEYPCWD